MAFGLTIGTERAIALQNAIQEQLLKRELSPDADTVMAEYITIMVINDKTAAQITAELTDLLGSDFDSSFVDWLFAEVEKSAPGSEIPQPPPVPEPVPSTPVPAPARDPPPHIPSDQSRRPHNAPRPPAPLYQQAISQAIPSTSPSDRKRTRSSSPSHSSKARRLDVPTAPRAMFREGNASGGGQRSLLDRVGPMRNGHPPFVKDDIQARIDNITGAPGPDMPVIMPPGGYPMNGMPPVDMNAMAGMTNPLMLQEMMMNQMALMSQMAGAMGLLNPAMMGGGFPMQQQGMGGDMSAFNGGMNAGPQMGAADPSHRGRGRGRGTSVVRGSGRGRGGQPSSNHHQSQTSEASSVTVPASSSTPKTPASAPTVAAPTPVPVAPPVAAIPSAAGVAVAPTPQPPARTGFTPPERPQSPTLCKFGLKCTNPLCRWSHPSPVATPESGVVLSNEACENGKNCKDKDCIKAHVSPAVLNPSAVEHVKPSHYTPPSTHATHSSQNQIPCRFGAQCTRPGCVFAHPSRPSTQPCRFGAACTRANCQFQHPEGRVLPSSFHRGLSATGPIVNVPTPETGSMGGPSHHRSVTFNKAGSAAELERRVKEMEEKKSKAEAAVAQAKAQATAGKKDDGSKSVSITA